ncbi:hypothetical protein FYJ85_20160 [Victivallaceae bacterium BBE-744-WT-12]|uniref:F5/8 type C domain-containing protein n=2 Tax=Victivallis lenta TaxID=2606640 RepID=A0A844G8S3_9BACT|nr:hypothetical protein [Victivallis lenta]
MNRPYVLFLFSLICIISVFPAALAAAETGPAWNFGGSGRLSGWSPRDMNQTRFTADAISFVSGRDSSIVSPDVMFSAAQFPICEIVMRADRKTVGELFFAAPTEVFSQQNSLPFQVEPSTEFQVYRIDCRNNPLWTGTVARLRFDPAASNGIRIQVKSIRLLPADGEEMLSAEYVGMASATAGQDDDAYRETTLTGIPQPPPAVTSKLPNQLGFTGPVAGLRARTSREIPAGNIFGAAICGNEFFANTPETKGALWSACWLNDGEELADVHNTVYSSAMHYSPEVEEWCMIELKKHERISRIALKPRHGSNLDGFPVDFHILCSNDGSSWTRVAEMENCQALPAGKDSFAFDFEPIPVKFVKVIATRLRAEGERRYYFQLREVEAFGTDGVNYAAAGRGGTATAGNPLGSGTFDYRKFYDDIFDSGAQWLFVSNNSFLSRHRTGKPPCTRAEIPNAEYLQKNGVKLIYRFLQLPSFGEYRAAPERVVREYVEAVAAVVGELRGKVAVWSLANEQNFYGDTVSPDDLPGYREYYVALVGAAAERVRQLDPQTPIEIETALFDFGWTEAVLAAGLAGKVDRIGVHIYKELRGRDTFPEAAGAVSKDGKRSYTEPYRDYGEQITAFRKLLGKYNPRLEINVSETGVNTGDNPAGGSYYVSAKSQAKFLARLYTYHLFYGIGPTCWWSLEPVKTGEYQWGLILPDGQRKEAWYALRNVAAVLDNSCRPSEELSFRVDGETDAFVGRVLRNDSGEYIIPYWAAVKMRDGNTGKAVDLIVSGPKLRHMEAVDTLSGTVHPVRFEQEGEGYRLKNMILRDYPVILRIR